MKKFNFLAKVFSLVVVFVLAGAFSDLSAQSFISEDAAIIKLSSKIQELDRIPSASVSFPNGTQVVGGDINNGTRRNYYEAILSLLESKTNPATTQKAYEQVRDAYNARYGTSTVDPKSTSGAPVAWMHDEALKLLTN